MTPFVRNPYNYSMDEASDESACHCTEPTLAQQQFKEECDINTIVRRFGLTGEMPNKFDFPSSADFDQVVDFQSAMDMVVHAREEFMRMPADVRQRFNNDPQQLLTAIETPDRRHELEKLGILQERVEEPPPAVVSPAKGEAKPGVPAAAKRDEAQ